MSHRSIVSDMSPLSPSYNTVTATSNSSTTENASTIATSITEVYRYPSPPRDPPSVPPSARNYANLSSDVSYDMTSIGASSTHSFAIGDMVLANGQIVDIASSTFDSYNQSISYAVCTATNKFFIAPSLNLIPLPSLPTQPPNHDCTTSSTFTSTPSKPSFSRRNSRSIRSHHSHTSKHSHTPTTTTKPNVVPPLTEIYISDDSSLSSTIKTSKSLTESPIAIIFSMRREYNSELNEYKKKEELLTNELDFLRQQVSQL